MIMEVPFTLLLKGHKTRERRHHRRGLLLSAWWTPHMRSWCPCSVVDLSDHKNGRHLDVRTVSAHAPSDDDFLSGGP